MKNKKMKEFSTKELGEELMLRAGIETIKIQPYENKKIEANGPSIVLIIRD